MKLPNRFQEIVEVVSIKRVSTGLNNVEVRIKEYLPPQDRGRLLLDLEEAMCEEDPSIRIWHTPLGDKNTLRNLRGVQP
jgi:hypothetical protein